MLSPSLECQVTQKSVPHNQTLNRWETLGKILYKDNVPYSRRVFWVGSGGFFSLSFESLLPISKYFIRKYVYRYAL